MNQIKLSYTLEEKSFLKYIRLYNHNTLLKKIFVILASVFIAVKVCDLIEYLWECWGCLSWEYILKYYWIVLLYSVLLWYFLYGATWLSARRLKKIQFYGGEYFYTITKENLSCTVKKSGKILSDGKVDWSLITFAFISPEVILLGMGGNSFYFMPIANFKSETEASEFKEFLKVTIKKVQIIK